MGSLQREETLDLCFGKKVNIKHTNTEKKKPDQEDSHQLEVTCTLYRAFCLVISTKKAGGILANAP